MKISLDVFKKYENLLCSIPEKGNQKYESIYFDFKESFAYLFSSSLNCKIKFSYESEESDANIENFLIPFENFLTLFKVYNTLSLKDKVFYVDNDTYEFPFYIDNSIDFSIFNKDDTKEIEITYNQNFTNELYSGTIYSSYDKNSNLNAVFLRQNRILSTDKLKLYEGHLDFNVPKDINIPQNVAKSILSLKDANKLSIQDRTNLLSIDIDSGNVQLVISNNVNYGIPDTFSDEFVKLYDHETSFTVDRQKMIDCLSFLSSFYKSIPNSRIFITITQENLQINIKDFAKIKKQIPLVNVSAELIGKTFILNASDLYTSNCTLFDSQFIKYQIDSNKPALNIVGVDDQGVSKQKYKHIVLTQLRE